jgi:hypothetical protein
VGILAKKGDNSTLIAKSLIYGKNPFVAAAAKMFE